MATKITDYKTGETVTFYFIDNPQTGVIESVNTKDNSLSVRTPNGIVHKPYLTDKESKFCYIKAS